MHKKILEVKKKWYKCAGRGRRKQKGTEWERKLLTKSTFEKNLDCCGKNFHQSFKFFSLFSVPFELVQHMTKKKFYF